MAVFAITIGPAAIFSVFALLWASTLLYRLASGKPIGGRRGGRGGVDVGGWDGGWGGDSGCDGGGGDCGGE